MNETKKQLKTNIMTTQELYVDIKAKAIRNFIIEGGQIYDAVKKAINEHLTQIEAGDYKLVFDICSRACLKFA